MSESQEALHFLDYWQVIRARKEIIIAVFLFFVVTAVVVTYSTPRTYMASTVIQIKKDTSDVDVFTRERVNYDPLFLRTQFEIIQSRLVLEEMIRRRDLTSKFAKAFGWTDESGKNILNMTYSMISGGMRVQQYRDTDLIEIQIRMRELGGQKEMVHVETKEAADMVAQVYIDQNTNRDNQAKQRALDALSAELEAQRKLVKEAESKVEDIRKEYEITVVGSGNKMRSGGQQSSLDMLNLMQLETDRIKVRLAVEGAKARLDKAKSLSDDELLAAAPFISKDLSLPKLVMERRSAEVQLNEHLKASMGTSHPQVLQVRAVIESFDKNIAEALDGLRTGMQADYDAEKARLDWIEAEVASMREKARSAEGVAYRVFNSALEELEHRRTIRDNLEDRYVKERIELRIPKRLVEIIEPAEEPRLDNPVSPNLMLNVVLGVVVGLCAGVALAYFTEYLDTSVKTIEDIEQYLNTPVLGVIPQKVKPLNDAKADSAHAEAYRMLRTNIQLSKSGKNAKILCFTSGSMGEGKSLTAFNMAYVAAEQGDKVLLIDADLHRPRQHKMLNVSNNVGLANVLVDEIALDDAIFATPHANMHIMPSGKQAAGIHGLLDNRRFPEVIKAVRDAYDVVIVDAPPIIGVSDTSIVVRETDAVLLVIQHRKYPKSVSNRARVIIENMGANLVGVTLNKINISRDYTSY
ncbi:hypothetical protein BVX94_03390, partial [bacterium B17]